MTKLEYIESLVAQGLMSKDISAKTREWEAENAPAEVKTNDVATQDANVTSTTGTASESSDGTSDYFSVAKPSETHSPGDGYEYKYEVNEEGVPTYYSKAENANEWIASSEGSTAQFSIAGKFKHVDVDTGDLKDTEDLLQKTRKELSNKISNQELNEDGTAVKDNTEEMNQLIEDNPEYFQVSEEQAKIVNEKTKALKLEIENGELSEEEIAIKEAEIKELEYSITPLGIATKATKELQEITAVSKLQNEKIDKQVLEFGPTIVEKVSWLDDNAKEKGLGTKETRVNKDYASLVSNAKTQLSQEGIEPPVLEKDGVISVIGKQADLYKEEKKIYQEKLDKKIKENYRKQLEKKAIDSNLEDWIDSSDDNIEQAKQAFIDNPIGSIAQVAGFIRGGVQSLVQDDITNQALNFVLPKLGFDETKVESTILGKTFLDKSEIQQRNEAFKKLISLDLDPKLKKAANVSQKSPLILENIQKAQEALANGKYQTQEEVNEANKLLEKLQNQAKNVFGVYEENTTKIREDLIPKAKTVEDLQMLDYNFNLYPIFATNALNATIEGVQSIAELGYRIVDMPNAAIEQMEEWTGAPAPPGSELVSAMFGTMLGGPVGVMNAFYPDIVEESKNSLWDIVDGYQDELMSGMPPSKSLGDLEDMGDWGRYTSVMLGSQLPNTAVMFGTGGFALPLLTAQAGGGAFLEMESDMKNSREANTAWLDSEPEDKETEAYKQWRQNEPAVLDYSPAQMYGVAMGKMALEYGTETLSLGLIKNAKTVFSASKIASKGFIENVAGLLTPNALKVGFYSALGIAGEGLGEGTVELGGNILDRLILGKEVDLLEGVPDAMFQGVLMAGGVYKSPALFRNVMDIVQGPDTAGVLANNQFKIEKLQKQMLDNPNMSIENKKRLKLRIAQLVTNSSDFVNKDLDRYSTMDIKDIKKLSAIELEKFKLKNELRSIANDTGIVTGKDELIAGVESQLVALEVKKSKILEPQIAIENKNPNRPILSRRPRMYSLAPESMQSKDASEQSKAAANKAAGFEIKPTDPVKKQTYATTFNDDSATVEITTNKDGSRIIRLRNNDGNVVSANKISKDNTLSNEAYIKASSADDNASIDLIETIDGVENIINKKALARLRGEKIASSETQVSEKETKAKKLIDSYAKLDKLAENDSFNPEVNKNLTENQKNKILQTAGGTINSVLNKLWKPGSLLTKAEFKKQLETEYIKAYLEYSSAKDKGQGIARQVSNLFNLRANAVATRNIKKGNTVSTDSEKAQQVADKTEQKNFDEVETQEDTRREKVYSSETSQVQNQDTSETKANIKNEISKDILLLANKGKNPADVAAEIKNNAKSEYFKTLRKDIGKFASQTYKDFVNSIDAAFVKSLPISTIKRRFGKLFGITQIGTTPTKQISKTGKPSNFNKPVYSVPKVTDKGLQDLKDYFLGGEKRQQSLYNILATDFALESINELMQDADFMQRLETALSDSGITALEFMQTVETKLDSRIKEDTSLDVVDKRTVDELINDTITEENIEDITPDVLTKAITKLDRFTKPDGTLKMDFGITALAKLVNTGLKTLKLAIKSGVSFAKALSQFIKDLKQNISTDKGQKVLNKTLIKTGQMRTMQEVLDAAPGENGEMVLNQETRPKAIIKFLKAIVKGKIPSGVLELSFMQNFASERARVGERSQDKRLFKWANKNNIKLNKNSVYYLLTNGNYIEVFKKGKSHSQPSIVEIQNSKFGGEGVTLVPAKGGMFYGQNDPNYIEAKRLAKENDALYPEQTELFKKAERIKIKDQQRIDEKFIKDNEQQFENNKKARNAYFDIIYDGLNKGDLTALEAAWMIRGAYAATNGIIKISAEFIGTSIDFTLSPKTQAKKDAGGDVKETTEEHSPPASTVGQTILAAMIVSVNLKNKSLYNKTKDAIDRNFFQTQLAESADFKLNANKLGDKLPEGTSILTENIGWVRLAAADVNLNLILLPLQNQSAADFLGFPLKGEFKTDPSSVSIQNKLILERARNPKSKLSRFVKRLNAYVYNLGKSVIGAVKKNVGIFGTDVIDTNMSMDKQVEVLKNYDKTLEIANSENAPRKGISVFDFDDTLARTKEKVIVNKADGTTIELNASQFAEQAQALEDNGATFDFTNFENVINAEKGPLADLALKRQGKFGSKDIFVLTARPQIAATGIKKFLDGIGLNLPLENITGLENGSPQAKANWIISKTAEGYNDFYFADDAIGNVKAVKDILDQVDVKSKVQLAKFDKTKAFDTIMNDIIEGATGIETYKEYSAARAKTIGANKGKYKFLTTPSAEDFLGLIYKLLGKGKIGDAQMAFFKTNIIDPYNRAESALTRAKTTAANDFKALKSKLKTLPKSLAKKTGIGGFTFGQAVRVAIWTRQGMTIPGLSQRDVKELNDFVSNNAELDVFASELIKLQKGKPYPKPGESWLAGTIVSDIINDINKTNRKEYLQEWQENIDVIFSDKNMNKLEAAYGPRYIEALKDQIRRMKSGSNRPIGGSRIVNNLLDWLNNSVGAIMFLNTRSAVLQTISAVNFINWSDNNLIAAGKAFANQKQYWKDFMTLFNSPYLVDRRDGLKINVSESEIADAVSESTNKPKAFLNLLLSKGFVLTRFADSFAIAAGGSTFYRNRVNALIKQGMTKQAAEAQAFEDFYAISEESQQSSNPSKISQQQASGAGRVILAFANTPMQYTRIIKRSTQDLINGRGDWKSNMSKIVYYAAIQNVMFNALQTALFALAFDDEEDETEEARQKKIDDKTGRIANGMIDSLVRGLGIQGAAIIALKDALMTIARENNKDGSPDYAKAIYDMFGFSPPLDSKLRKLKSAANTLSWDQERMEKEGFNLNNPAYLAGAQVISALTNLPLDRAIQKMNNLRAIFSNSSENWQKVALTLGWGTWDLGLPYYGVEDKEIQTPQTILRDKVLKMKKDTSGAEQKQMLLDLGLTKQQIKALKYEEIRIKKIIELQNKKKDE